MIQKYVVEALSSQEIASSIDCARSTVLKWLKTHKIPMRGAGQTIRKKKGFGLAYGRQIRNRRLRPNLREVANIEKMMKLREQGYSYWKVADIFNSMGIPTQTSKGKWHAKSIQQIVTRNGELLSADDE